jgi:hypothetical protein
MRTPKGFRDISTTYQRAYATLDGNVQVREIGKRLWEVLPRGGSAQYANSKEAAIDRANQLTFKRKGRR